MALLQGLPSPCCSCIVHLGVTILSFLSFVLTFLCFGVQENEWVVCECIDDAVTVYIRP